MMDIEWEQEWDRSLEDIRARHSISTYESIFPADLLESIDTASLWRKLMLGYQLIRYNLRLRQNATLTTAR